MKQCAQITALTFTEFKITSLGKYVLESTTLFQCTTIYNLATFCNNPGGLTSV